MVQKFPPRTTRSERETVYLPLRDEICASKRIDTEICSSNLVFGAPEKTPNRKRLKSSEKPIRSNAIATSLTPRNLSNSKLQIGRQ